MKSPLRSPRARGIWFTALSVIILAVLVLELRLHDDPQVAQGGPMGQNSPSGSILSIRLGHIWTDGQTALYLSGREPAVITAVRVVGGDPALQLLGVRIAGPDRRQAVTQEFFSYPPRVTGNLGTVEAAVGAEILPTNETRLHLGYELLVGYKFVSNVFSTRSEIVIDYSVSGSSYEAKIPARLVLCPTTMTDVACQRRTDLAFPNG